MKYRGATITIQKRVLYGYVFRFGKRTQMVYPCYKLRREAVAAAKNHVDSWLRVFNVW